MTSPPDPVGFQDWSNRVQASGRLRFELSEPSVEARTDELAHKLWILTAQAVANPDDQRPSRSSRLV